MAAAIASLVDSGSKAEATFKDIMTSFVNFASLGDQAMADATAKFDAQLDQWNKWTNDQLAPALGQEAEALEQIKIIDDNVNTLVSIILQMSQETLQDVQTLKDAGLNDTPDLVSGFEVILSELETHMTQASTTIGNTLTTPATG